MNSQLSEVQKGELWCCFFEFTDVESNKPGRTQSAVGSHQDRTVSPIGLTPCRISYAYRDQVQREVEQMLKNGIVEPSQTK